MARRPLQQAALVVGACTAMWAGSAAAAGDATAAEASASGLGLGGAYLFGLCAGLVVFGVRLAIDVRKTHLAEYEQ